MLILLRIRVALAKRLGDRRTHAHLATELRHAERRARTKLLRQVGAL